MDKCRVVYAGNRRIGMQGLRMLLQADLEVCALLLPAPGDDGVVEAMRQMASHVPILGKEFTSPEGISLLRSLAPDYILSVHFPYIFTEETLSIPSIGTLNLHPAYLPCNRGWHTPSWAIIEQTPFGGTLHWIDLGIDSGDIALQRRIEVLETDTAHSLYQRVLDLELAILREAMPLIREKRVPRRSQGHTGTLHKKSGLRAVQEFRLSDKIAAGDFLRLLRGLTTNRWDEAAYYETGGKRYRIHIEVREEELPVPTTDTVDSISDRILVHTQERSLL